MLSSNYSIIPQVEDIKNLDPGQIASLKKMGICYMKVSNLPASFDDDFEVLRNTIINFFKKGDEEKKSYNTEQVKKDNEDKASSGYIDRRNNFEHLEAFYQILDKEVSPLIKENINVLEQFKELFAYSLAINLLEKLIGSLEEGCDKKRHLKMLIENLYFTETFVFYSKRNFLERMTSLRPRFNPHRDKGLITLIMLNKPGLKFWNHGYWHDVLPKPGYCVVVIGDLLDYLSEGKIKSCLHMVNPKSNEDRLSAITFISSKIFTPLNLNVHLQENIFGNNNDNLKNRIYDFDFTDRKAFKSFFSKLRNKFNLCHIVFSFFLLIKETILQSTENIFFSDGISSLKLSFFSLILSNIAIQIFRMTYFETMLLDYLHHFDYPSFSNDAEKFAYTLGESSLSIRGSINSISSNAISHYSSFWNAGFVKACVDWEKSSALTVKPPLN